MNMLRVGGGEAKPLMALFTTPLRHQLRKRCCNNNNSLSNARLNSTSPLPPTPTPSSAGGTGSDGAPAKLSLFARFKQMYKDYYYVLIPVHIVTSIAWFGGFYQTSKRLGLFIGND